MSTCDCGGDSALSTTGSIVGILTFALGLLASYAAIGALTREALYEIDSFSSDLERIKTQVNSLLHFFKDETRTSNSDFEAYGQSLQQPLKSLLGSIGGLMIELEALDRLNTKSSNPFDFQARRRIVWVLYKRKNFIEEMARVSSYRAEILGAQMSLLLRCVSHKPSEVPLISTPYLPLR